MKPKDIETLLFTLSNKAPDDHDNLISTIQSKLISRIESIVKKDLRSFINILCSLSISVENPENSSDQQINEFWMKAFAAIENNIKLESIDTFHKLSLLLIYAKAWKHYLLINGVDNESTRDLVKRSFVSRVFQSIVSDFET